MDLGHIRIYHLADDGASWEQIGKDINGNAAEDYSGYLVSLLANGLIVAIGSPGADINGVSGASQVKVY